MTGRQRAARYVLICFVLEPGSEVTVYHLPNRPDKCAFQLDKGVPS